MKYCKNCKWHSWFYSESECTFRKFNTYNEFNGQGAYTYASNEKGDCEEYKRKWYKFWIN